MPAWASDWKESLQAETPPPLLLEENFDGSSLNEALTTYGNAQVKDGALVLDGSTGTYAELDGCILAGKDSLTVSMDLTTEMTNQLFFTFAIGDGTTNYAFLRFREQEAAFHITNSGYQNEDQANYTSTQSMLGQTKNIVMTFEPGKIALFVDGRPAGQANTDVTLADLGGGDAQILLGKSFFEDPLFMGSYDNLKIYDGVMSAQLIAESNGLDWDQAKEELEAPVRELAEPELKYLTLTTDEHPTSSELYYQQKIQNPVTDDIVLWKTSHSGYSISWQSSHPQLLTDQGELLYIPEEDTLVTLTATIQVPGVDYLPDPSPAQKELTVLAPCAETRRQLDYDALVITTPDDVRDMLPMVRQGDNGCYTRDFQTFSEPEIFVDTSVNGNTGWNGPFSSIDTTIAKEGDTYYRITKNNDTHTCYFETSTSLQGPWTWGGVIQGTGIAEGPTHYQLPDGRWVLLVDNYSTYVPFVGDNSCK